MTNTGPEEVNKRIAGPVSSQLCPDQILVAEFEYIAQTAFQANEDRARVSTFSLVTAGTLIAAMLGTRFDTFKTPYGYWAFTALFVALALNSTLTLLELVRLRQAWFESILALNQIKEFYTEQGPQPKLGEAFRWNSGNVPPRFKRWSVSFLLAIQVSLLGSISLGAALIFAGLGFGAWWWIWAIGSGTVYFIFQVILYWRLIRIST